MMDATGGSIEHAGGPSKQQLGTFGFTSLPGTASTSIFPLSIE